MPGVRELRRILRLSGLLAATAALLLPALVSRAMAVVGLRARAARLGAEAQALWARCMLRGMGVRLDLPPMGRTGVRGPFLVVANHLSYLDIFVLGYLFPGRFVAKHQIASWPVIGPLARSSGTIFLRQARRRDVVRVGEEIDRTLAAGVNVVLFPEGGASRGARIERLHSALLESAVRHDHPCLAVALSYDTPGERWAPAATVCWWGGMGLPRHLWTALGMPRIVARVRWSREPAHGKDRKELARRVRAELERGFVPVRQEPIAPDCPWREQFAEGGIS